MSEKRPPVPARVDSLDRRAVERVLARAAELQATRGGGSDSAELLSETALIEIAHEAGLDTGYVQQALAEERTHLPDASETGWTASQFGAARIASGRTVNGPASDVLSALDAWMQKEECMRLQRRFPERIVWEPRSDIWGSVRRSFGQGTYDLSKADTIGATAVDVGGGKTLIAMEADLSDKRRNVLRAGAGFVAAGAITAVVLSSFVVAWAVPIPLVVGAAIGWMVARSHRARANKVHLALEQTLDKVEYGEVKPPTSKLADAISAATRPLLR